MTSKRDEEKRIRINQFFKKEMTILKNHPVIVEQTAGPDELQMHSLQRDGYIQSYEDGKFKVRLLPDSFEVIGYYSGQLYVVDKAEEEITLDIPKFFESYDEYIDWIMKSSLDEKAKRYFFKQYVRINKGYKEALVGSEREIEKSPYAAWDMPRVINLGSRRIRNTYYR